MNTLYERLGGSDGIAAIANDLVDLHLDNPRVATRYASSDIPAVKQAAADFFITGSGGPDVYRGKDMVSTHRGMNIDNDEFVAVLDDALEALDRNGVSQREKEEVLFILYGLKDQIVRL